ncbi:2-hydroxychromene-2-carboxylate isomerase [Pendulispora albinea]|uniref:2-hydroxychromene-2-carboxylate isomerase n=1 Tax=Pendulispora albinea TaxID=2741071 RepID=A0ABZ2M9I1_9BACT
MIDFWFELGSNYSYLSVMRIEELARRAGVAIRWQPFLLGPIFASFGWETSPFVLQKEKGAYVWKDMVRQCKKYGLAWKQPTVFPRRAVLPTRVALYAAEKPWIGAFCKAVMLKNFAADDDIDAEESVRAVLDALQLPAAEILREAQSAEQRSQLRAQTEKAKALGIFGAPMFFVKQEMYWGNDRLEDALASLGEA